ncbi:hypothetical protein EXN66_Car016472 [Channa argus]|uniref:Uncharacterized protein n=1 Tax=Channa argus TaxID=215402 RepID=A0A6G1QED5_CHAAH|nr:hypothetical protein EXN66_Car016472 [Channa argus]
MSLLYFSCSHLTSHHRELSENSSTVANTLLFAVWTLTFHLPELQSQFQLSNICTRPLRFQTDCLHAAYNFGLCA